MFKSKILPIISRNIIHRHITLSASKNRPLITVQTTIEKENIPDNFQLDFCKVLGKTLNKDEKVNY